MKYRFNNLVDPETGKENHLHEILVGKEWKPLKGTSTVVNVLAKNLTWWAAELSAVECLEKGEKIETIREEYELAAKSSDKKKAIDELQKKYPIFKKARFAHFDSKNKKADEGTNLHEILEMYVKHCIKNREGSPDKWYSGLDALKIQPFIDWSVLNVKKFIASEAHCYSERLWLGGITDCVAELIDGTYAIIDFKSAKEVYPSYFLQAELYAIQIEENGLFSADGKHNKKLDKSISSLIVVPFGASEIVPVIRYNIEDYKKGAEAVVVLDNLLSLEK